MRTDSTKAELVRKEMALEREIQELRAKLRHRQDYPLAFAIGGFLGAFWRGLKFKMRGF